MLDLNILRVSALLITFHVFTPHGLAFNSFNAQVTRAPFQESCILTGNISADSADPVVTHVKVEAALDLAIRMAGQSLVGTYARDSINAHVLSTKIAVDQDVTLATLARHVGCDHIVFANVKRFARLIRAEVDVVYGVNFDLRKKGIGYASITYARGENELIADPAILLAMQRALASALTTNPRFDTLEAELRALPAPLVSVGGIEFINDPNLAPWEIFKQQILSSYDLAQTIVTALQEVDTLTVIDIETRDSMYALAGLLLIENNRPISALEMRVLRGFDVGIVVTGTLERNGQGALLTLCNSRLRVDGTFDVVSRVHEQLEEDSKVQLREAAFGCIRRLYGTNPTAPPAQGD